MSATGAEEVRQPRVHASALVVGEAGVLIRGPSGSGKSSLALALLALADNRRSFVRLIGDDRYRSARKQGEFWRAARRGIEGLDRAARLWRSSSVANGALRGRSAGRRSFARKRAERSPCRKRDGLIAIIVRHPSASLDFRCRDSAPFERAYAVLGYLEHNWRQEYDRICSFRLNNSPQCTKMPPLD